MNNGILFTDELKQDAVTQVVARSSIARHAVLRAVAGFAQAVEAPAFL